METGQLKQWHEQGDQLIVCMDASKHIYKKSLGKSLPSASSLAMNEVVGTFTNKSLGATLFVVQTLSMEYGPP